MQFFVLQQVQLGQLIQDGHEIDVVFSEQLLIGGQRAFVQRLSFFVPALADVEFAQFAHFFGQIAAL